MKCKNTLNTCNNKRNNLMLDAAQVSPLGEASEARWNHMVEKQIYGFFRYNLESSNHGMDKRSEKEVALAGERFRKHEARVAFLKRLPDRIQLLLWNLQETSPHQIHVLKGFLEELEDFIGPQASKTCSEGLQYLKDFFEHYPKVTGKERLRAIEKTLQIYESLGFQVREDRKRSWLKKDAHVWEKKLHHLQEICAFLKGIFATV